MKALVITLLMMVQLLCAAILNGEAEDFLQIQPSAAIRAMGYGYNGVADIWHRSPVVAWNNPALPSLQEGFSLGCTFDNKREVYWDRFSVGMLSMGYKGLGITLPSINTIGRLGTTIDYGQMILQDTKPNSGFKVGDSYETAQSYGAAFNTLEYLRTTKKDYPDWYNQVNLAAGIAYVSVYSHFDRQVGADQIERYNINTHVVNAGLLVSYRDSLAALIAWQASAGYQRFNLGNQQVTNPFVVDKAIGQNDIFGIGTGASLSSESVFPGQGRVVSWSDKLLSVCLLGSESSSREITQIRSVGMELGLLDTFYYRKGYWGYNHHALNYQTSGYGFKLHNTSMFSVEANYARAPELYFNVIESWDFRLYVDLVKLFNHVKK